MRARNVNFRNCLLGLALLPALLCSAAGASEIRALQLSTGATGTRAEIALDRETAFSVIRLAGPDRLVVDLPASSLGRDLKLPGPAGVVKSVRTGQPVAGTARIVFDLSQPIAALTPRIEQGASGPRLVLEWPEDGMSSGQPTSMPAAAIQPAPVPAVAQAAIASASPTTVPAASPGEQSDADRAAESAAATTRLIT
ncbi:MAG: AMIN domain-containing protein, partial [Pseudomonadota bacterium]|nr:AMIN domain-containing protein [Pseudomonadota bacterium]